MVKEKERGIPCIFYFYLQSKLKEKAEGDLMPLNEVKWRMFQWRIPHKIKSLILKEMELLGLVEMETKRTIKFIKSDFNIDNLNGFSKELESSY